MMQKESNNRIGLNIEGKIKKILLSVLFAFVLIICCFGNTKEEVELASEPIIVAIISEIEATPTINITYEPFTISNLSEEEFNIVLENTGLSGCGYAFVEIEETHGVNGLFAIGVAMHESANGYQKANENNYFGFRGNNGWMSFSSPEECIKYFGKLMNNSAYYGKTIEGIGQTYCPGNWGDWANKVNLHMGKRIEKLDI